MTLQQLKYIVAIDRYRNFAKAADACGISQPTLSAMLVKLEEELDVRIFERSNKSVTPTIGIEAEVTIYTGEAKDVLTVSDKSVYTDDEGDYVFAIVNGKVEKRYITKGLSGDGRIEVTSGLSEGEKTIVSAVSEDDLGSRVTEE